MMFSKLYVLGSLFLAATVAATNSTNSTTTFNLIATSEDLESGAELPVFYADGAAYVGTGSTEAFSDVTNITFTRADPVTSGWTNPISINPVSLVFDEPKYLGLNGSKLSTPVVFIGAEDAVDGFTTKGFGFWADNQLTFLSAPANGTLVEFGVVPTDLDNVWLVKLDGEDTANDGLIPAFFEVRLV